MAHYAIGVDFGTLSARALVVDVKDGKEMGTFVTPYAHAVMDEKLPDGTPLGLDWALQHPKDYLDSMDSSIRGALKAAGVLAEDVIGLGIDFTACTMLPVAKDGTPLCFMDKYKARPHAYVKLWKHHAAQQEANLLNDIAAKRGEDFLSRYGGRVSSEWMFPKVWQILNEDEAIYNECDRFMEAADWVLMQIIGKEVRSSCVAGYKDLWSKSEGFPSSDFFKALDPRLENVIEEKFSTDIHSIGQKAGEICESATGFMGGLKSGIAVAVANVDAHVAVPAAGIDDEGKMLLIMGTSTCHIMLSKKDVRVKGMAGIVEDGVLPGFFGYEAGQSCVGDHFDWFVKNLAPKSYVEEAQSRGISVHDVLTERAQKLGIGESGLLALDWWNGNRSILMDADLTGVMLGMTLATKPEDIYRALLEATAYGTRKIIETFENAGVAIKELYACGGIAVKNPLMMQIYADVTNRPFYIAKSDQAPALGSAMFGAVAAGKARGGYESIFDAAHVMGGVRDTVYMPNAKDAKAYDALYKVYERMHDLFGLGGDNALKDLKAIKNEALGE